MMISFWPIRKKPKVEEPKQESAKEKLVIYKKGKIVEEIDVTEDELSLGRGSDSDIQLSDPSVSRHHAVITRVYSDLYIEDLGSTNGTQHNGHTINKHVIHQGDELSIGNFEIKLFAEAAPLEEEDDLDKTVVIQPNVATAVRGDAAKTGRIKPKQATLRFLSGPDAGGTARVDRSLYTLGQPGGNVAVIARRPQGFYLLHIGGDSFPRINGQEINAKGGVALNEGDTVEVGDIVAKIDFSA